MNSRYLSHLSSIGLLALLLLLTIPQTSTAQSIEITGATAVRIEGQGLQRGVDTLTAYRDRATSYFTLDADTAGFVLGTNNFSSEVGVHYNALGGTTVNEVMVYTGYTVSTGLVTDTVYARFYNCDSDSMPDAMRGEGRFPVDQLNTSGQPSFITIDNPGTVVGDFFVSIAYGHMIDTIALISSSPIDNDGQGEKRMRQLTNDHGWQRGWDLWTFLGMPYDADPLILPVVVFGPVSADEYVQSGGLRLHAPYPQPAQQQVSIPYSVDGGGKTHITVFDMQGRTMMELEQNAIPNAKNTLQLDTQDWPSGQYIFQLASKKGVLAGKFLVQE